MKAIIDTSRLEKAMILAEDTAKTAKYARSEAYQYGQARAFQQALDMCSGFWHSASDPPEEDGWYLMKAPPRTSADGKAAICNILYLVAEGLPAVVTEWAHIALEADEE